MQQFSHKVTKRRHGHLLRRQNIRICFIRFVTFHLSIILQNWSLANARRMVLYNRNTCPYVTWANVESSCIIINQWSNGWWRRLNHEEQIQDDSRPTFSGPDINVTNGINMTMEFYLKAILDQQTINRLLRLIKNSPPKPNRLPIP